MNKIVQVGFDPETLRKGKTSLRELNPAGHAGLLSTVSGDRKPVTFINDYDVLEPVRCAFCEGHQRHNRGYTLLFEDGSIALCGNRCAEILLGAETAEAFRRSFAEKVRKAQRMETIRETFSGIDALKAAINGWVIKDEIYIRKVMLGIITILPESLVSAARAGDIRGVDGRALSSSCAGVENEALLSTSKIKGFIRSLEGVAGLGVENIGDEALTKAVGVRQRLIACIVELSEFFDAFEAFMTHENLERLLPTPKPAVLLGNYMMLKNPSTGPELHIRIYGQGLSKYSLSRKIAFDRDAAMRAIRGSGLD